jgi:hypothetical protein
MESEVIRNGGSQDLPQDLPDEGCVLIKPSPWLLRRRKPLDLALRADLTFVSFAMSR